MPIYEYECKSCGTRFDKVQPITAEPLTECINCGKGPIRRIFHPVGVIFKGSGWYVTDSRKSSATSSGKGSSDADTDGKSKSDEKAEKPSGEGADAAPAKASIAEPPKSE